MLPAIAPSGVLINWQCATLKSSYQTNADLETQLKVAQSNLKLEQANTEILEDALKSGSLSKDVGWRRSTRDAGSLSSPSPPVSATIPTSQSQPQRTSIEEGQTQQGALESPNSDRDNTRAGSPAPTPAPTATQPDSRFFRFRFTSSGRSTPTQPAANSPPSTPRPMRSPHPAVGHLTSASLPSLVASSPTVASELEELRGQLLDEKRKSEKIVLEKKELETELESLSQALFEEANKMVAVERIKRAEAEEELKDVHAEKVALKAALHLIEEERMRAESSHLPRTNGGADTPPTRSRSSSCDGIVSPRARDSPGPPSPPPPTAQSRSQSPGGIPPAAMSPDGDVQEAPPSPAPLYVPPPHLEDEAPASRTESPMPLPHPHRDRLSIQRPTTAPPAPPPPSAADGFPITPWAREGDFGRGGWEDEDVDEGSLTDMGLSVPRIVTFTSPSEGEMPVPW
jgi:hypothetical protein